MTLSDQDHPYQASGFLEPFTALPNSLVGKVNPYELAVLFALQHRGSEIRPSLKRLAEDAGMGLTKLQQTLASLKAKGLLSWEHRFDGQVQLPSLFHLHVWAHLPQSPHGIPMSSHDTPHVATRQTPCRHATTNKNNSTRTNEQIESATLQAAPPIDRAGPVQPTLLPSDTPVANTGRAAKKRPVAEPIPDEFAHLADLINPWLDLRLAVNTAAKKINPWGPRQRSAAALRYAIAKGVAQPFLEIAAERGWVSLGHEGHKEQIDRLAAPSRAFSGASRSRFQSHNPEPRDLPRYDRHAS